MLTKKLTLLLSTLALCACHHASAQDSLLLRDYRTVQLSDPWLTTPNAAALTRYAAANIAEAELSLIKDNGGLVNYDASSNTLQADARVESYYRLSPRAVVFGAISYNNFTGRHMTGSAFMHLPSLTDHRSPFTTRAPFDIVEDSLANPGRKHRDVYRLTGAVGYQVYRNIAIGLRVDYTAANYAKYKDLRHKNKLMDLHVSLGTYAPVLSWLNVGAGYTYHRTTESVDFGTYGKNEKVYKSLIDHGAFMGIVEQFGNEGYTDKSHEMPLFEDSHGATLQLEAHPLAQWTAYGSFAFSRGDGYYGRKSPFTITYTEHERHVYATDLTLLYTPLSGKSRLRLDLAYQNEKLTNSATTRRELTNESGANYYEYYDAVEMGDKQWNDVDLAGTALLGLHGELPTWQLSARYHWTERKQAAYLFPYYRHQQLTTRQLELDATRNLIGRRAVWSLTLNAGYQAGSGAPYHDYTFVTPSAQQETPATMDAFLYREYYYLTARQYHLGTGVKYAFVFPKTRLKTYARVQADYRRATESCAYNTGQHHTQVALAVGCNF